MNTNLCSSCRAWRSWWKSPKGFVTLSRCHHDHILCVSHKGCVFVNVCLVESNRVPNEVWSCGVCRRSGSSKSGSPEVLKQVCMKLVTWYVLSFCPSYDLSHPPIHPRSILPQSLHYENVRTIYVYVSLSSSENFGVCLQTKSAGRCQWKTLL